MKKHLKKSLAILLVATSFNFLSVVGKASSNILTYADVNTSLTLRPDPMEFGPEIFESWGVKNGICDELCRDHGKCYSRTYYYCYEDKNLGEDAFIDTHYWEYSNRLEENVAFKDLPFYINKKICDEDPKFCDSSSLKQLFQKAKDKIYDVLGLNYTDKMETPIYVTENWYYAPGYSPDEDAIHFKKSLLKDYHPALAHEMTHALVHNFLGKAGLDLNRGMDEGFATQNENLQYAFPFIFLAKDELLFKDSYPNNPFQREDFYILHNYIVKEWIKAEGKEVVKKYLEDVKNGKDSVQAFLDLGGDKVVEKYKADKQILPPAVFTWNIYIDSISKIIELFRNFFDL